MVPGCVPFKIVSDSPTLHSRWLLFFKVMLISLWNLLQYHSIVRWAIQAQWAEPLVLLEFGMWCSFATRIQIPTIHLVPNILEHTHRVSVVTMDIYLIIMKKDCKALVTKNRLRRLINADLEQKKTQNMRKNTNRLFSPSD